MRGLLVVLALALAGCLQSPDVPAGTDDGDGTFRFIEVTRLFRADADGTSGVCGFPSTPEVDEANRTVTFHGDWPGTDYRALVLTVTWDRTRCGVAYTTWSTSHQWSGTIESGNETMEMREDGAFVVNGEPVPRGGNLTYTNEGVFPDGRAWTMTTTVRDRGEWPLSGVRQADAPTDTV